MELKNVKLIEKLAVDTGVSKAGKDWKKQVVIVETDDQYPKKVAVTLWNDAVDKTAAMSIGSLLSCQVAVESREYNGRWYTDVAAKSITNHSPSQPAQAQPKNGKAAPAEPMEDLPF